MTPVDLIISNLDTTIEIEEMCTTLSNMFKEYCTIMNISIGVEGNIPKANVRVANFQEAQLAISQLDSRKVGSKRISVSYQHANTEQLRLMVISLLKDVPGQCMPLFKFFEIVRSRYISNISLSEINSLADICKIIDSSNRRMITLTHTVQVQRFTVDLLRVINSQRSKTLSIILFPHAYEQTFFKSFNPREYGACSLEDLLCSVEKDKIVFGKVDNVDVVSIRKRVQTVEEIRRTQQFAIEVTKMLQHFPYYTMPFNTFLPSYHHYFGRQCKVTDYGFTKLIELFEAIPETVELEGFFDMDRKIKLTLEPLLEVAGAQIVMVIKRSNLPAIDFDQIVNLFRETFEFNLKPETYDCATILDFLIKLDDYVQVHYTRTGPVVTIVEIQLQELELRLWAMLLHSPHKIDLKNLKYNYRLRYENNLPSNKLQEIKSVEVWKSEGNIFISLTPFYTLAASLYHLLSKKGKPTKLSDLVDMHFQKYHTHICPTDHGAKTFKELLLRMDFLVIIREENKNDYVILNKALSSYGVPIFKTYDSDQITWPSPPLHSLTRRPFYISPPKPDTPPLPGCWSDDLIFSPDSPDLYHNLQIPLPLAVDNKKRRNLTVPVFLSTPSPQAEKSYFFDNSGYVSNSSRQEVVMFNADTAYQFS